MNKAEYEKLSNSSTNSATITASVLKDRTPRTLVYGYELDRKTRHIYLSQQGDLVDVIYDHNKLLIQEKSGELVMAACVPSKRAYPSKCDYEFCAYLAAHGVDLVYTTFEQSSGKLLHGELRENLINTITEEDLHVNAELEYLERELNNCGYFDITELNRKLSEFLNLHLLSRVFDYPSSHNEALIEQRVVEFITDFAQLTLNLNLPKPLNVDELGLAIRGELAKTYALGDQLKKRISN